MTAARGKESGVILINVLVLLALSSAIVVAMLRLSDDAIARSQRYSDAGQGLALITGAEAAASAVLRRDAVKAPETDHLAEPWARLAQDDVAIQGGTFAMAIEDAQGKFNLTTAARGTPQDLLVLQRILAALDLPDAVGLRILARLADPTPLGGLDDLLSAGLTQDDLRRLSTLVTALPQPTPININTMPDAMFEVLAGNPVQGRLLQGIRARKGQLTQADLLEAGLIPVTPTGVTSSYFILTTRVTIGQTTQTRISLLARIARPGGTDVVVAGRKVAP